MSRIDRAARYRAHQWHAERLLRPMQVGRWTHVRGRPFVDAPNAVAGDSLRIYSVERTTAIKGAGRLRIGNDVFLNSGVWLECWTEVTIGDHVVVGWDVTITDSDMHGLAGEPVREKPVALGSGSWVGAHSIILPGVNVGTMSMVAAGSVVTRDVPARHLVAGNPARVVREIEVPEGAVAVHGDPRREPRA